MDKPNVFFGVGEITIVFFGDKVVVEKATGNVFLNGLPQFGFRNYLSPFVEKRNLEFKKKRLIELKKNNCAFVVNRGIDGRLFFLFWNSAVDYQRRHGKVSWQASYWLHGNRKEWFEMDLHTPKEVF